MLSQTIAKIKDSEGAQVNDLMWIISCVEAPAETFHLLRERPPPYIRQVDGVIVRAFIVGRILNGVVIGDVICCVTVIDHVKMLLCI